MIRPYTRFDNSSDTQGVSHLSNELHLESLVNNASWDAISLTATLRDVQVQDEHYLVELKYQPNNLFKLTKAEKVSVVNKGSVAQYDVKSEDLVIPSIQVTGKNYKIRLHHIGNFDFRLDQAEEIK